MTLGLVVIVPLILDIDDHTNVHNFIICMKLKQSLTIQIDMGEHYDAYATFFLKHDRRKIATDMKNCSPKQQEITPLETPLGKKWEEMRKHI